MRLIRHQLVDTPLTRVSLLRRVPLYQLLPKFRITQKSRFVDERAGIGCDRTHDILRVLTHPATKGCIEHPRIRADDHIVALVLLVLVPVQAEQIIGLLPAAYLLRYTILTSAFLVDAFVVNVPVRVVEHRRRIVQPRQALDLGQRVVPERMLLPQFTVRRRNQIDPPPARQPDSNR